MTSASLSLANIFLDGAGEGTGSVFDQGLDLEKEESAGWIDNITNWSLSKFKTHYNDPAITKDDIFDYVYGVLHVPALGQRFKNALSRNWLRVPMADCTADFRAFVQAGQELSKLHLGYESCEEYPLELQFTGEGDPQPDDYRIVKKMKFAGKQGDQDNSQLFINDKLSLMGVPEEDEYVVNGKSPLGWFMDRYKSGELALDKESGKVNDDNDWWDKPEDLVLAIRRIVFVSVETRRIIKNLPTISQLQMS